jgi:hypothetical protein
MISVRYRRLRLVENQENATAKAIFLLALDNPRQDTVLQFSLSCADCSHRATVV